MSRKSKNRHTRRTLVPANRRLRLPEIITPSPRRELRLMEIRLPDFLSPTRRTRKHTKLGTAALNNKEAYSQMDAFGVNYATGRHDIHCVKRSTRKEVLHALKKTGKAGQKRAQWKPESRLPC